MWVTLLLLISHPRFVFTSKTAYSDLVVNFCAIIKEVTGSDVDVSSNSPLSKLAQKFLNIFKRKYKGKKSVKWLKENEEEYLVDQKLEVTEKKKGGAEKRKSFEDLKGVKPKKIRVESAIEEMEKDPGLKDGVFKELKIRKESSEKEQEGEGGEEEFMLAILGLMKKLGLSETKLDDFRFGIRDLIRRGFDLTKIPYYQKLRKQAIEKMIPPGLTSCETGASVPIVSALHHTGRRFLLRSFTIHYTTLH